ncbi:MAG: hypothetical protein ACLP50_01705 [Solirubrobacteraceae bacterium]
MAGVSWQDPHVLVTAERAWQADSGARVRANGLGERRRTKDSLVKFKP